MSARSCLVGKNFTNINYISGNGRAGQRTCGSFPRPQLLGSADGSPRISLCLWTGLVIHWVSGFLLIALSSGSMRITAKNLWNLHQPSKNPGLSEPHSCVHLTSWQQTEGFEQTLAGKCHDGQAYLRSNP